MTASVTFPFHSPPNQPKEVSLQNWTVNLQKLKLDGESFLEGMATREFFRDVLNPEIFLQKLKKARDGLTLQERCTARQWSGNNIIVEVLLLDMHEHILRVTRILGDASGHLGPEYRNPRIENLSNPEVRHYQDLPSLRETIHC